MTQTPGRPGAAGPPHSRAAAEVLADLGATVEGLASDEARRRAAELGPNRLAERATTPTWHLLVDEFRSPLVLILIVAALVLLALTVLEPSEGRAGDAGLILAIVVFNASLGFAQNYRAQRGIESLRRMTVPSVRVLRDGRVSVTGAEQLVTGDVVLLEEGDRVPADGRLIEVHELVLDEAPLTGESLPVAKSADPVVASTPLAERTAMVYMGTAVGGGRGRFVVTAIGMATEIGAIAEAVQAVDEGPTPFQREIGQLGRRISLVIGGLILVIAALQLTVGGQTPLDTFVTAVALAVAAIPEGLPVVLTLALAFGTRRMLERRSLVRSLPVVEIIGAADVICTDKTGTVTEGRMSLRRLYWLGRTVDIADAGHDLGEPANLALLAAALCNDAQESADGAVRGDPTEVALLVGARSAGVDLAPYRRTDEIPFSSDRKRMSVVVERDGERLVFAKGAPEVVLETCTSLCTVEGVRPMTDEDRRAIAEEIDRLGDDAYRVLALAGRDAPASREEIERELVFYGLAGLADPPREAAGPALASTRHAGIRVLMITGDNPRTAAAVGREIGLEGTVRQGRDLDAGDVDALVDEATVFARVEPGHKLRILNALRARDHVVVMTGDGVNDAPALKAADVGIAMGARGTDVARDASDMVLLDDNFATIVAAIEEGRRIAANIRKFLNYLLTGNVAEVLVILVASLFGQLPITAVQILWVNLVTDSGPAVALAVDPPAPGLMDRPPRRGPILGRAMLALVGGVGAVIAAIVTATFFVGLALFDLDTARTMTFTALVAQEYLRLAVIRVHEGLPLLANRWLVLAVAASLALQLLLIYSPLGGLFDAVPLGIGPWAVILGGLAIGFPAALVVTRLVRRAFGPL